MALRYDLLYRLGVLIIRIPPLRERMEDLEKLIRHFLNKYSVLLGKKINAISADVMDLLHKHQWIGNVRGVGTRHRRGGSIWSRKVKPSHCSICLF